MRHGRHNKLRDGVPAVKWWPRTRRGLEVGQLLDGEPPHAVREPMTWFTS